MSNKTLNLNSLGKISSKISSFYSNMSKGKKIYACLWLVTGIFLVAFITIVSVFAPKIGDKVYNTTNKDGSPASYTVSMHAFAGQTTPEEKDIVLDAQTVKVGETPIAGVNTLADALKARVDGKAITQDAFKVYDLTKAAANMPANGKAGDYFYTWGNGKAGDSLENGEWSAITPSDEAGKAQDSIAGVGLGFAVALMGAVAATVLVSVKEAKLKKAKSGGNK